MGFGACFICYLYSFFRETIRQVYEAYMCIASFKTVYLTHYQLGLCATRLSNAQKLEPANESK